MADYAKELLDAIELLAEHKIINAGFDKTIKATVQSSADAAKGIYSCKYEATTFTAIGDKNAYQSGDIVMVNIPQNNWDNVKTILNKVYTEIIGTKTLDPFANFLDVNEGKPLIITGTEVGVAANDSARTSRPLGEENNFANIYTEPQTRMGVEVAMKTAKLTSLQRVNGGNYGISLNFYKNNSLLIEYVFNTEKMIGNLYNFGDYTTQRLLLTLDPTIVSETTSVSIQLFQDNDFTQYNEETGVVQPLDYSPYSPGQVENNIFAKGLKLYFGYDKEEIKDGDLSLNLDADSGLQYYFKWTPEQNTKSFNGVYWKQNKTMGQFTRYLFNKNNWIDSLNCFRIDPENYYIYLEKQTSQNEWVELATLPYLLSSEDMARTSVNFRVKIAESNFDTDADTLYSWKYSNEITLYQYKATVSTLERDLESALFMTYSYDGLDGLQYNDMENQLLTQKEHLCPHSFLVHWEPLTEELKDPSFFAGATLTYKVPAFDDRDYGKDINKANDRFKFEATTVIQHPEPGQEYGSTNSTIRYEIINNVSYLCWDIVLANDFGYTENGLDKYHWWANNNQQSCDMQAFTLDLRPKEYYLPSMVNNTIYCTIKKDDLEFTASIEFPIAEANTAETLNRVFILTEDMKKPYLLSYISGQTNHITSKIFHLCTYRQNYNGEQSFKGSIEIMRPLEEGDDTRIWLRDGYWYKENDQWMESVYTPPVGETDNTPPLIWYTLDLSGSIDIADVPGLKFLMLQTKNGGITSIIDIPIYRYVKHGATGGNPLYLILEGINKIYFGSNGESIDDTYGPQNMCYKIGNIYIPDYGPISDRYWENDDTSVGYLTSYETNQNKIFPPEIVREPLERSYYPLIQEFATPDSLISAGAYYKFNNNYCLGIKETDSSTGNENVNFYNWENGERKKVHTITSSQFPYTADLSSHLYKEKETIRYFLRFNQPGFTINYKEVGSGDDYPAETLLYADYYSTLPIVFQQRQLYRDDFAQWDGTKVQIGEDAVYSPLVGAGRKNENNQFSGCLMGDISTVDFTTKNDTNLYGLYGYHEDVQSFGLRADGTMFIGKRGNGQILLDGDKGTIESGNYALSKSKGMLIDLDDAIIEMKNNELISKAEQEEQMVGLRTQILNKEQQLVNALNNLYNESGIYNYIPTEDSNPVAGKTYYYVPLVQPNDSLTLESYQLSSNETADGHTTYYIRTEEIYTPIIPSEGTSVWSGPVDTSQPRDPDKTYFVLEDNVYIPQEPDDSWEAGVTYQERQYYWYEKKESIGYDYNASLVSFQGNSWPVENIIYYERVLPEGAPAYGYNLRAYSGEYIGTEPTSNFNKQSIHVFYPTGDGTDFDYVNNTDTVTKPQSNVIYYEKKDDSSYDRYPLHITKQLGKPSALTGKYNYWHRELRSEGAARVKIYYDNAWHNIVEEVPDLTDYEKYNIKDGDISNVSALIATRRDDESVTEYQDSLTVSQNAYGDYTTRRNAYDTAVENYNTAFYNNLNYPKILKDAQAAYEPAKRARDEAYEAYMADTTNLQKYDTWQAAEAALAPLDQAYQEAQNINQNHTTLLASAQAAMNGAEQARDQAKIDYLETLNHIASGEEDKDGLRVTYVDYNSHMAANEDYEDQLNVYQSLWDEYNQLLIQYVTIYELNIDNGKDYGIKIDASDENLYNSQGKRDTTKFPLIIGDQSKPSFQVDWAGQMFATAGQIGGWTIDEYQLRSENNNCILTSKKSISSYPLEIGNNFRVAWDGTVTAKKITLDGGTLDGGESGSSIIKNIDQLVYKGGGGLKLDSNGYLHLNNGIILDEGGSIKAGGATLSANGNKLSIEGGLEISQGLKFDNHDCYFFMANLPTGLDVNTTTIDGQTVVTGVSLVSNLQMHYIGYRQ